MQEIISKFEADKFIDARHLFCPEPIMLLHQALNNSESGTKILMATKDPAAPKDVRNMTRFLKHQLLKEQQIDGIFFFLMQKK